MHPLVLDTDVFSFLFKNDTRAELYRPQLTGKLLCVCFQTIAEVRLWSTLRN